MTPEQMQALLRQRQHDGLYRQQRLLQPLAHGRLRAAGKIYLNFSGNDYLGFAGDHALQQQMLAALSPVEIGSTGSPLITGFQPAHQHLTDLLCDWLGAEDVLLFSSGFAANQAMLSCLAGPDELLLLDKLCHASMIDVARQHPGGFKRFLHNDLAAMSQLLARAEQPVVIATEGVFSMDGDSPNLPDLLQRAATTPLLLDDAHGLGVQGAEGRGSWALQGVQFNQLQCLMANFGKALGAQGGFLAGSKLTIDYLRQQARHYIYSTALSPLLCALIGQLVQRVRREQWRRDKLNDNIAYFRELALAADLPVLSSQSAIQPLWVGATTRATVLSDALKQQGIWLSAIRPPTVAAGQARLRITLSSAHQHEDIQCLVKSLRQLLTMHPV